ncbi:MAG: hypothetical protein QOG49_1373 [Frankiaceae bacterium]|jgi:hypothetical protein|nr:hypothetical protein [Frankiaceae bacterium]
MRQTQILRTHHRRAPAAAPLADIPSAPVSDTADAAAVIEAIDAVLETLDAV